MTPATVDALITLVLSVGLIVSGVLAVAALPWRDDELDAVERLVEQLHHALKRRRPTLRPFILKEQP